MPEKYEVSRFLAIQLYSHFDIHSQKGIKMLFNRVEILLLEDLNGVEDIFYRLNMQGFQDLKHLSIISNSDIQSLVNPEDRQHPEKVFPKLESLLLYNLSKMGKICSCDLSTPSFEKLKVIKINMCDQLKNVFFLSVVKLLTILETIEVSQCKSLEEIVQACSPSEIEFPKFPELRSLTLQSLSKLIGFYSEIHEELVDHDGSEAMSDVDDEIIEHSIQKIERRKKKENYPADPTVKGETELILFHEKVEVSKLERMELSSIQIDFIWSDKYSPSSNFQNLLHLDVNGCWNLEYLLSFSMAKNLKNLQSLFVSECEKMTHLFHEGQDSDAEIEGSIFPNVKNIKLSSMKSLSKIWDKVPLYSFGKLDTLIIEECDKLDKVFPCYMEGIFRSLCNLRVTNCESMKAIFDLENKKRDVGEVTNLQDIHLEALPKLKNIWRWNSDQEGFFNLNNLRKMWVHNCLCLENIFPIGVAECLYNLEYLLVSNCYELREMVANCYELREMVAEEGIQNNTSSPTPTFEFKKLTTIKFLNLPKLRSFYADDCELRFPALDDLAIELCDKLEPFEKTADAQSKSALFPEEVINQLKSMKIELLHAMSSRSYMGEGNYRRDNLEELHLSRLWNIDILYSFLHKNPKLKSLSLSDCSFKEVVPHKFFFETRNLGVVPELKSLKLIDLPELENIGFERDIVLQRIEFLVLNKCPNLFTIVPSSVSLTYLTNLEVVDCNGLKNLILPLTAKSLGQLKTMKVVKCESLVEIVGKGEENAGEVVIVFRHLKTLELVSLKSLARFCSSNSCIFEFPTLEKLIVCECPKMEKFSEKVSHVPILQNIYVVQEKEKGRYWKGDLNATFQEISNKKSFLEGMGEISFSEHPCLEEAWRDKNATLQNSWFYNLKTLKLFNCETQRCAIPSHVLPYFNSLQELEVSECGNVEVIFEMDNNSEVMGKLQKLTLKELGKLKHVWENYHRGKFSFQNLQQVFVTSCHDLKTVFPGALAENLKKLEKLEIVQCEELQEIFGKEKDATAAQGTKKFVFPRLTSLYLEDVQQLTYFYPETFTLDCPELNSFSASYCNNLEVFQSEKEAHPNTENEVSSTSKNRQPLFSDLTAIPNLEVLRVQEKHISMLSSNLEQSKKKLKCLNQLFLGFSDSGDPYPTVPFKILEMTPNLETMYISCCSVSKIGENDMLGHLKILWLIDVDGLEPIWSEDSPWLDTLCVKLHKLYVINCYKLTTLVHSVRSSTNSVVSFSYLKELIVEGCYLLKYLFTSSAAKMLRHLEEIRVRGCNSMEEIVAKEQDEKTLEDIKFEQLNKIVLKYLPSLKYFYSGNDTLHLPSLIQVDVRDCPNMEIFSKGLIHAKSFRGIQVLSHANYDLVFQVDLNTSLKKALLAQRFPHSDLQLEHYPILEKAWLQRETVPNWCFNDLTTLIVERCEFLTDVILPSHLLPFLSNLEQLEVRECNSVKAIFKYLSKSTTAKILPYLKWMEVGYCESMKEIVAKEGDESGEDEIIFEKLETLTLETLPGLVSFDMGSSALNLSCLKEASFINCRCMKYLFTSSTAKTIKRLPNLKEIRVSDCESLEEIVAKEGDKQGEYGIIFEKLEILTLKSLPRLGSFDLGRSTLNFPGLKIICFYHCHSMEYLFTPSTAKRLPNLKEMYVRNCKSIKEIVTKGDESEEDEIIFQWLEKLSLSSLPELKSFYSGSSSLNLPRLKKLDFKDCNNMKIFHYDDVVPEKLEVIINEDRCEGGINDVIKQQSELV